MQRLHPLAAAAPRRRAGRARAAVDRARHADPGGQRDGPALVPAALGRRRAVAVRRGGARAAPASRTGSPRPPPRRRRISRCSCRSSWKAAGTRCRCSRRSGKPRYHELRPTLARQEGEGVMFTRGRRTDVAPAGRWPRNAARRGQGHGVPGDRLRPARREPLHEPPLLGGRRARRADALGLDGPLSRRRRRPGQPAAGPVARLLARAGAGEHAGSGRGGLLA